jgi:hypothetical protein
MEGLPTTQRGDYAIQTGWHASLLARLTCLRTTWHGLLARDPVAARERRHRAREVDFFDLHAPCVSLVSSSTVTAAGFRFVGSP